MQMKHLRHKHGAEITAIHAVEHDDDGGVPIWYFKGDLLFDGTKSPYEDREISPCHLYIDGTNNDARAELDRIMTVMNEHLLKHGRWLKKQKAVGDRIISWQSKAKKGRTPIA